MAGNQSQRERIVRPGYWVLLMGAFASLGVSHLYHANATAAPSMVAAEGPVAASFTATGRSGETTPDGQTWLAFTGETRCKGINEWVSFAVSSQRQEVRDLTIQETCQHPGVGIHGKVQWRFAGRFPADSKGRFAVTAVDWTVSTQTAISIRGELRATGRITRTQATGTLSDHVALECTRGQMLKNCRKWTASVVTNIGLPGPASVRGR
jgi:hypothetical protein